MIELPLPEKISTNIIYSGVHWTKRSSHKNLYREYTKHYFKEAPVEKYPVEITYEFEFIKNALDTTNCSYMAKLLEDSLVTHGVLKDDSPKYVSATHIYSAKGTTDSVKITIK